MNGSEDFYTLKGYSLLEHARVTAAMEDYLEMLFRFHREGQESVRIKKLAEYLHVKPSSASKMAGNLKACGLVRFEKYGGITLTETGIELGEYLLTRHEVLHRFFCHINHSQNELEQVEKVEHFVDPQTVWNIKLWLEKENL